MLIFVLAGLAAPYCAGAAVPVGREAVPEPSTLPASTSSSSSEAQEGYLVVVGDALAGTVAPFAQWKESLGFKVEVATTSKTGQTVDEIKNYIQKACDTWKEPGLKYVLLVGDVDTVPADTTGQRSREYPATDLVYSTLRGDDDVPDVGIGRLPAKTAGEAKTMFDKIIYYEKGEFSSADWVKEISFIAPQAFHKQCENAAEYCVKYTKKAGYTGMFPNENQPGGDKLYAGSKNASTRDLLAAFNQGRSIIVYQGHAFEKGWADPMFMQRQVAAVSNTVARPFVISISCLSGRFNHQRDCIGETWMKSENGAVAYFGASGNSLFPHCLQMQRGLFDAIFRDGHRTLSEVCNAAKQSIYKVHGRKGSKRMAAMYNLLGDPSMKLRIPGPDDRI
jgi:hypothetical protein